MSRQLFLLDSPDTPWEGFLSEYLEDTAGQLHSFSDPLKAGVFLNTQEPDLLFINSRIASLSLIQKLKVLRQHKPESRIFDLDPASRKAFGFEWDDVFGPSDSMLAFQKKLSHHLPLPASIRILLIDDELEVAGTMEDYFQSRINPSFVFQHAPNGKIGLQLLKENTYDVIVLDIKMPVMDGREVYGEIKKLKIKTPVIIFFDAIFDDELAGIYEQGHPAVVEKGSWTSSMPEMMLLTKKMVYFT